MSLRSIGEGEISEKSKWARLQIAGCNQLELEGAVYSLSITIEIKD
jgi:hypothetical protein